MNAKQILETERLILRELNLEDTEFILALLNDPSFLEFIGDKKVRSLGDAKTYLETGPIDSYKKHGFGLWLVLKKEGNEPIGMCGLVKRDTLDDIDIGFALMPEHSGKGFAYEAAQATMNYARHILKISKIVGITNSGNSRSIKLLNRIGLQFEKTLQLAKDDIVLLFSPAHNKKDTDAINSLVSDFFGLFNNQGGRIPNIQKIKKLFIVEGTIINNTKSEPEICDLDRFIQPREAILTDGTLTDFDEREVYHETKVFKDIAQRFSLYEKTGVLNGMHFEARGTKTFQFIRTNGKWKISSVAWCDETE